jgi:hypothetical protein
MNSLNLVETEVRFRKTETVPAAGKKISLGRRTRQILGRALIQTMGVNLGGILASGGLALATTFVLADDNRHWPELILVHLSLIVWMAWLTNEIHRRIGMRSWLGSWLLVAVAAALLLVAGLALVHWGTRWGVYILCASAAWAILSLCRREKWTRFFDDQPTWQ